jgi:Uma2 family endonuclease
MAVATLEEISLEQYFTLESRSELRHEFHDGRRVEVAGASLNHNYLAGNLYAALWNALRSKAFSVFMNDMRVWIPDDKRAVYPDVMVVADPPEFALERKDTLANPRIIAEVLSSSTEAYDRGDKFKAYRSLPSLAEYLLISQSKKAVDHFVKNNAGKWVLETSLAEQGELALASIDLSLDLDVLYDKVFFEAEASLESD